MEDDANELYENFWAKIVENEDGSLNPDRVKAELWDYHFMLMEVPKVYSELTGGMLSKTNYYAKGVIEAAEEYREDLIREAQADLLQDFLAYGGEIEAAALEVAENCQLTEALKEAQAHRERVNELIRQRHEQKTDT